MFRSIFFVMALGDATVDRWRVVAIKSVAVEEDSGSRSESGDRSSGRIFAFCSISFHLHVAQLIVKAHGEDIIY